MEIYQKLIQRFRTYKSKRFDPLANLLLKIGLTANIMTFLSFLSGLAAVYFVFSDYWLFLIFAILHLFFDAFDGVLARKTKETKFGKNFDLVTDNLVAVLLFVKLGWYLQDFYPYIIAGLYGVAMLFHIVKDYPSLYLRTSSLIVLFVATFPGFPVETGLLTLGYLVGGGVAVYSLALQLQYFVKKNF